MASTPATVKSHLAKRYSGVISIKPANQREIQREAAQDNHLLQADRRVNLNTLLLVMGIVLVAVGCLLAHRGTLRYTSFCIGPGPSNPTIPT